MLLLQTLSLWFFASLVQLITWDADKSVIRIKLQAYAGGSMISDRYIRRYQIVGLILKSTTVTVLCMVIYCAYWSLYQTQ